MSPGSIRVARRFRWWLAITVALVVTIAPFDALAQSPGHYLLHAYRSIRFRVNGAHGYVVGFAEGSRRHLTVTVRRGPAVTEYQGRAPRDLDRFELRGTIGGLGEFNVHFTPRGNPRQYPRYSFCAGPGPTIQRGVVRGEISFRGERDYTTVDARFAHAELERLPSQRCRYLEPGNSKHPRPITAILSVDHETGGPGIHFEARRFAPGSRPPARQVHYEATDYEDLGSLRVVRRIQLASTASTFRLPSFDVAPENAVITPPAPFAGSGTFSRTPESTFTWSGDLSVTFPGLDPLPLADLDSRLYYCALSSCIDEEPPQESAIGSLTSRRNPTRASFPPR
jgi:hypothetical protein